MSMVLRTAVLAMLVMAGAAQADVAPGETTQINERDWEARCRMIGGIFYRLGEQRLGGVEPKVAAFKVSKWAGQAGDTGSHQKMNYNKAVENATAFVYSQPELLPPTLAHFGYRSCYFEYRFGKEPNRVEASQMLLLESARACQKEHPALKHNPEVRDCIAGKSAAIEKRVAKARITVAK